MSGSEYQLGLTVYLPNTENSSSLSLWFLTSVKLIVFMKSIDDPTIGDQNYSGVLCALDVVPPISIVEVHYCRPIHKGLTIVQEYGHHNHLKVRQ